MKAGRLLLLAITLMLYGGCKSEPEKPPKPETTIENLKVSHAAAYHRVVFYNEAAKQADAERLQNLGSLYRAIARSEEIHAAGHAALLAEQNEQTDTTKSPSLPLGSVRQSLKMGVSLEATETQGLYPAMIQAAAGENWTAAGEQFSQFLKADERQGELLAQAQERRGVLSLRSYCVCTSCGYIMVDQQGEAVCPVCGKNTWERL